MRRDRLPGAMSRRDNLLRRTPVRLALAFTLVVASAYLIAMVLAYGLIREQLTHQQDVRISEVFGLLSANADRHSDADLVEAVRTQIAAAKSGHSLFLLRAPDGAVLTANVPAVDVPKGWSNQPPQVFGRTGDVPFRVYNGRIGRFQVLVARDYTELDLLRETIQSAMVWSSLFALVVALGGGIVIALRMQRRLTRIERTMDRVAEGDLAARLPLTPRDDDIDRVADQVNAALGRLQALVEGMRQVSADIAHELRSPLNRLRMRINEAAETTERGADPAPALAAAISESAAIERTFSALLRIAQIEAGTRRERFAPVDLVTLAGNVADVYADVAEDAGMRLECLCAPGPLRVNGDTELLTQTIANLLENAIRHCPAGTNIRCRVGAGVRGISLSVADDGPGIPADERDRVLHRLYRLERSRTTAGSGLGLSLVKAVADLHGAALSLSDARPGLRVTLEFPPLRRGGSAPAA